MSFQVNWGINDTPLTRALELGDDVKAASIIRENSDPSFLNEGPYERVPLYIVVCGLRSDGSTRPINLHLAKLLLENGADPNKRLPLYELGIMIYSMRTSQSPMEMLVMLYIHCIKLYGNGSWETAKPLVIGVHGACISFFNVVKEELLQIIDLFVAFGAEVELRHTLQFPMLHYLVQQYPDVELISRLCENGANIQKEDHHGNTILHILVQMKINDTDRFLKTSHVELMQYLLHHPNIKVDAQNCQGHSPLWLAFATGHFDRAQMLLECGADSVKLHRGIISFPHSPWVFSIPSLLAAVVRSSQLLTPEEDGGVNSPIDPSFNVLKHRLKETTLIIDKDGNFGDVSCSCSDADSSSSVESDISDNEFSDSEGHNGDNQSSSSDEEYFETHF
ncbi:uncharacterized protein LOC143253720 isoform X7 [Tachypleus tridentatus]|uniref:uncharacterized protein LOC143253720 isoform X7 n=1 Tax=Tachypleus tridentatus TaxID=6853 RepID=UPI003FD6BEF9